MLLLVLLGVFASLAAAGNKTAHATGITTSGLSAGAYMAGQYHIAFSNDVSGCALFAGGPYYCSQGSVNTAQLACMALPAQINLVTLERETRSFATAGHIDPVSNLDDARVFVWSGTKDTVVKAAVVDKARDLYLKFGAEVAEKVSDAQHCQPTLAYGNACGTLAAPFISRCNYDGVGHALQHLLPGLGPRGTAIKANLHKIKQSDYFSGGSVPGLSADAHVYIPSGCAAAGGSGCHVHVAFHGCKQNLAAVGTQYVENAGYLEWAESNNIVVLFPDATTVFLSNPNACFDWWGYVNKNFAWKTSRQLSTVHRMVQAIQAGTILTAKL